MDNSKEQVVETSAQTSAGTGVAEAVIEDKPEVQEPSETSTQTESVEKLDVEVAPVEDTGVKDPSEVEGEVASVDRSAYNCAPCKGEGLVKDSNDVDVLCTNCGGTGKV